MKKLVFATNNSHKLSEIRAILGDRMEILSLSDIGCHDDIPEDAPTFEGNALAKAMWVKEKYGYDCFADDSGLEVDALGGAPGVYSARFCGRPHDDAGNNAMLLEKLAGAESRAARFRTAIALVVGENRHFFNGEIHGCILEAPAGDGGFGYDPLFRPDGWNHTFAQGTPEEKNAVSHRGRAVRALIDFLENNAI